MKRVIGHVCALGHYDFSADPEFDGQCGSKWVGTITVDFESNLDWFDSGELLDECNTHLAEIIDTWRSA